MLPRSSPGPCPRPQPSSPSHLQAGFDPITDAFLQPAKQGLPDVPTVPEMKAGFIAAMEADPNLAHHLDCKFESFISQQNKEIFQAKCKRDPNLPTGWSNWLLWTPPYCPAAVRKDPHSAAVHCIALSCLAREKGYLSDRPRQRVLCHNLCPTHDLF